MFKTIGLAREIESPENPGALEKRVALIPEDVKKLVDAGCDVSVEQGAGEGIGFSDEEYQQAGAEIVSNEELYADKDLIIKFKGPAMESIPAMRPTSTLFCMAHFHSFPDRAKLLEDHRINVVAMENVIHVPEKRPDEMILGMMAADACIEPDLRRAGVDSLEFHVLGYSDRMSHVIRRLMDHSPKSLQLHPTDVSLDELGDLSRASVMVIDLGTTDIQPSFAETIRSGEIRHFDVQQFADEHGDASVELYRRIHPPAPFGRRKIEALHETGRAGARYGIRLLKEESVLRRSPGDLTATVLGYGNVGMGAIHECYDAGVRTIHVLGKAQTQKGVIEPYLEASDLIVNGAEQPKHLRGISYLVSRQHAKEIIVDGSVVIDLVGGSATNRSAVENVIECTYLTDPHFEEDGVIFSALWGWPMMGFMRESAIKYSGQITDILLGEDRLIEGLEELAEGLKPALVCGRF